MSKNRTKLFILTCIVCVLTTTGCISQPGTGNQTIVPQTPASSPVFITSETPRPSTTETPLIIGPSGTPCPPTNETPYIIINPIADHRMGEIFEINGTTNLGSGEKLIYYIGRPPEPRQPEPPDHYLVTSGSVEVFNGDCTVRHWSFQYNTSEFYREFFTVAVWGRNSGVVNSSEFTIR